MQTKIISVTRISYTSGSCQTVDAVVNESPLEIVVVYGSAAARKTEVLSLTMRTRGDDLHLVTGFCFCEGIINRREDVTAITTEGDDRVIVELAPSVAFMPAEKRRNFMASSACGVCGKATNDLNPMTGTPGKQMDFLQVDAGVLCSLPSSLQRFQGLYTATGGAHAVALADLGGNILYISEDVGRHNAMDKLIGAMLVQNALPLQNKILLFSGRLGYELVQKSIAAGIRVICAIGAPTTFAVELAEKHGITLIGFLKETSFNIYCGEHRIIHPAKE